MTTVVISQPMLFPWVGMYEQLSLADVFVHYDDVQFSKGSFTNRVQIRSEDATNWLTIPVKTKGVGMSIFDLTADESRPWREDHRRQLERAYGGFAHVDEMLAVVDAAYADRASFVDVVIASMERLLDALPLATRPTIVRSSTLGIEGSGTARVLDCVRHFGGTRYVTGHGARNYLDHELFESAGVEVRYMDYQCPAYPVLAGSYTPYVSALDRIANVGVGGGPPVAGQAIPWREFVASPLLSPRSVRGSAGAAESQT